MDTTQHMQWPSEEPLRLDSTISLLDALRRMSHARAEHALVVSGPSVIGVFGVNTLSRLAAESGSMPAATLPLGPIADRAVRCAIDEDLRRVVEVLAETGGVAVLEDGALPERLVTLRGLMLALAEATEGFLVIADIERAIRDVIATIVGPDERTEAFARIFRKRRGGPPSALDDLSMGDYRFIITDEELWPMFENVFGSAEMTASRLETVRLSRNRLFHFSGVLDPNELRELRRQRWWFTGRRDDALRRESAEADGTLAL